MSRPPNKYTITIGPTGGKVGLRYDFELPLQVYERWSKLEFQFKCTNHGSFEMAHASVIPSKMISVKERWYHRVIAWVHFKFFHKPSTPGFA